MSWKPRLAQAWPSDATDCDGDTIVRLYKQGFSGAMYNPAVKEDFLGYLAGKGFDPVGSSVAHANGFAGSGAGKLILPFLNVLKLWPKCWGGPYQRTGDCVGWGGRNAILISMAGDIVGGELDEKSGRPEVRPEITADAELNSVLSSESLYWYRGHGGEGWHCSAAAKTSIEKGFLLRKNYPELGIDLTKYDVRIATKWGRSQPPANVQEVAKPRHVRNATELHSHDEVRDFLANHFGVNTCSSICGNERKGRDANGVTDFTRIGGHSQALIGYDDRADTIQQYGEPLVLWLNSWPLSWIKGGRRIRGTDIDIPEGSCWLKARSSLSKCELFAVSAVAGWPMPTWKEALGDIF